MKLILHEIELNSKNPEAGKKFYNDLLGLSVYVDQNGLKVFDSGWAGLDLGVSTHNPEKTTITFLVGNLEECVGDLKKKGCDVGAIYDTHLGMRAIELEDPEGNRIEIQCPTEKSPQYLHDMIKSSS